MNNTANHSGPTLLILNDQGGSVMSVGTLLSSTLRAQDHGHPPVVCFEPGILRHDGSIANRAYTNICSTLRAQIGDNNHAICYAVDSHPMDSRFGIEGSISPTVTAKLAKGSADGPLVLIKNEQS